MSPTIPRLVLTALPTAAVLALVLSACSPSDGATGATPEEGPLDTYLAAIYARADDAGAAELNARVEQLTAECMAAEGFEYSPPQAAPEPVEDEARPDDADWVAEYGYGLTTSPTWRAATEDAASDPNTVYVASLPEGEQQAFWATLYGDTETDPADTGCYGEAFDQVDGGSGAAAADEHQPLLDAIDAFWQSVPDAPERAALDAEWSDCMASAGLDFVRQPDAQASISDAAAAVLDENPDAGADDPAFAPVRERELALAAADLRCRTSTDFAARAAAVENALEQQFVDDHRSELDALLADAQDARADG